MKAFLFLALGLAGVLAAPTASEGNIDARSPCLIRCLSGYVLFTDPATKKCKCITSAEAKCLRETICIATHHPVWNAVTKKCTCEPYVFELSDKDKCLLATTCLTGSHPFWNPVTKKCSCNSNDAEFICKAATTCSPGSTPVWHPETETCVCQKVAKKAEVAPDPKTCPTIRCMAGTIPKWVPLLRKCICEKIPNYCPTVKCSAGYKAVQDPKTGVCSCKPDPTQCAGWFCIAEQTPVYDPKTGKCFCQWIPGLEPGAPTTPRSVEEEPAQLEERVPEPTKVLPEPTKIHPACRGIVCIAEQTPTYDPKSHKCVCKWIPGLEPGPPTEPVRVKERVPEPLVVHPTCPGIYCIAEKQPVYDPVSKRCTCQWIPGLGPAVAKREAPKPSPTPIDNCYLLKIYCEGGDHHMHLDPKTKTCKCPPVKPVSTRPSIPGHTYAPAPDS